MTQNIGEGMRRIWSADLQNIVTAIRNKTFVYEEKEEKPRDWSKYDGAQLNEIADMFHAINLAVDIASERVRSREKKRKRLPGGPRIPPDDVAKLMLLQGYFGFSNRVATGFLKVFTAIKFSTAFSYKTLERGYDPRCTRPILDELFRLTNEWSNFNETVCGIDGSGDPTTMKINYESKRTDQRKKKVGVKTTQEVITTWPTTQKKGDFQYSVLSCGIHTKIIAGFSTTGNHHVGELSQAPDVMKQTSKNVPNLSIVVGDGLYANRPFCQLVYLCNAALYSIPKSNSTLRNRGYEDWSRMTYELVLDPQGFLDMFHNRSISETVNSMMKRREPTPIRKRLPWRKDSEEHLKKDLHNLRQSCYLTYVAPGMTKMLLGG